MASGQPGGDHSGQAVKLEDTFTLLESEDLSVVEGIRCLILDHLLSGKEPWLANSLVEYYYTTGSLRAQEILAAVREPLDKMLIEKIQEGMRQTENRKQAMKLLLYIVDRQPPWTHRIVDRPFFPAFLKLLKTETDIPVLMTTVMTLVILLPVVPVSIESYLQDVFDIFARISGLIVRKPANSPDIFMLHLHIGVYVLFLRLYGMFPCTFLTFLRAHYAKKENLMVYNDIILPILEKVRFHPNLVAGSKEGETSKSRWRKVEPQDIVVNCAKLSLDPVEGTIEDLECPIIPRSQPSIITTMKITSRQPRPQDKPWLEKMELASEQFPVVIDPASYGFSPSQLLGLSTPPASQRATPAASLNDLTASFQQSAGGTVSASPQIVTPTPEATLREMPVMSDEIERGHSVKTTPIPSRSGPKTTPVNLSRARGPSAFTSPFSQPPSKGPSPMKPNLSSESLSSQLLDSATARTLVFDRIPESKDEGLPRHIEMRTGREAVIGAGAAADPFPMDSLPSIVRNLSNQDSDTLDLEVSRLTEVDEELESSNNSFCSVYDAASASAAKPVKAEPLKTAESVIQFMKKVNRIRFNSLTSNNSEPLVYYTLEKHIRPGRARSCPPLRRKPLVSDPQTTRSSNTCANATNSKLDSVSESAVAMHGKNDLGGETSFLSTQLLHDLSKSFSGSKDGSEASSSLQTRTCMCQCGKEADNNALRNMEQFASLFQCMLAPVRVALCRQCRQPLISRQTFELNDGQLGASRAEGMAETWIKWPVREQSVYATLSPPELLDRHLMQGSDLHTKELAHIPLTSKDNVSWTHFGGGPPVDEINILKGEILLLQNQVMYERHKRSNHAMRNRRLLRRIAHVSALEEQVQALTHQLEVQGKDVQNLQVSLKLLQDNNHRLQQLQDSDEYERLVDFKTTIQQNKDLQEANVELKNLLLTQKAENDELKKELQQVRAKSFEMEKYTEMMQADMASVQKWKRQVIQLQKEMLLMGEAQERLQNHLQQQQHLGQELSTFSSNLLIQSLKAEIKELKKKGTVSALMLEATQQKLFELEEISKTKDLIAAEVKNNFEAAKDTHAAELKAVEDKYRSMLHINQQLDAQVLKLQAENDCLKQKLHIRASRNRDDRSDSPQAGGAASHVLPSMPSEAEPKTAADTERRESVGEESSTLATQSQSSHKSKDRSQRSSVTSEQFSKSGSIEQSDKSTARNDCLDRTAKSAKVLPELQRAEDSEQNKQKVRVVEQHADLASELSDGGAHGLADSRAMMYTDSEDNGSLSSNSNLTTDSGIFSKVDPHAN